MIIIGLLLTIITLIILLILSHKNQTQLKSSCNTFKDDAKILKNQITLLQESNAQLSRFQNCIDAEEGAEAESIKSSAETSAACYINIRLSLDCFT